MTLDAVAEQVGYRSAYLSMVESGLRQLNEEGVARVAEVIGLDPGEAQLAALRERLPSGMRAIVPYAMPSPGRQRPTQVEHAIARELQEKHFDFDIEEVRIQVTTDWEGNVRFIRTYERCRPNAAGRPVFEIVFREQVTGTAPEPGAPEPGAPEPKLQVTANPTDLAYELHTEISPTHHTHRLFFPQGWRRRSQVSRDAFSFTFEGRQQGVYVLDPSKVDPQDCRESLRQPYRGSFQFYVPHLVRRLRLEFDCPEGYSPERWDAWAWWGREPLRSVGRNLIGEGVSRHHRLTSEGGHAELVVEEPLAGYSFAIVWLPADRFDYLHARYGGTRA